MCFADSLNRLYFSWNCVIEIECSRPHRPHPCWAEPVQLLLSPMVCLLFFPLILFLHDNLMLTLNVQYVLNGYLLTINFFWINYYKLPVHHIIVQLITSENRVASCLFSKHFSNLTIWNSSLDLPHTHSSLKLQMVFIFFFFF